jgi:hypothetical protein
MNDQSKGIINRRNGTLLSVHNSTPKVKIVVGQGTPNIGELGNSCSEKYPSNG